MKMELKKNHTLYHHIYSIESKRSPHTGGGGGGGVDTMFMGLHKR